MSLLSTPLAAQYRARVGPLLCLAFVFLLLAGCRSAAAFEPYIDLDQRAPLPAAAAADVVPLRIAVAAILSPQGTAESYSDLATYLGRRLGRPVELVQRRTYEEVNALVAASDVDLAFVCTSAYIDGQADFGMDLLVAPEIGGEVTYRSVQIVPASSVAEEMADLRGRVYAFTDPMSFSGRVYPTHLVQQLGSAPEEFFGRTFFTYSHDRAIQAVAEGIADGASVDSLVLDYALARDPDLAARIRIIDRSPAFGIPPVVVPPDLPPRQRLELQEALLAMDKDREGILILEELGIERFVTVTDDLYDSVRALTAQTQRSEWAPPASN
jgi:phosphonate transport system substrate-binding protein